MSQPSLTIGIEEEYQTIDPETRDLRSHISAEIISKGQRILAERVKPEMHQSVVEVGTGICRNIQEAKADLRELRTGIINLAKQNGLRIAAASTHPFADWRKQEHARRSRRGADAEGKRALLRRNMPREGRKNDAE